MKQIQFTQRDLMDDRKKELIALRMDKGLFLNLRQRAEEENTDLSQTIRILCRRGLEDAKY
jgi:hypothetical protein